MTCVPDIRVVGAAFKPAEELAAFLERVGGAGAVASFVGLCRDEAGTLIALELEHYPGMCEAELLRLANEAARRWPLLALSIVHRYGKIVPGEAIVCVQTASLHRREAFAACEFVMDFLKTRAPFWKKQHFVGGGEPEWVEAKGSDEVEVSKWKK